MFDYKTCSIKFLENKGYKLPPQYLSQQTPFFGGFNFGAAMGYNPAAANNSAAASWAAAAAAAAAAHHAATAQNNHMPPPHFPPFSAFPHFPFPTAAAAAPPPQPHQSSSSNQQSLSCLLCPAKFDRQVRHIFRI